MPTPHAPTHAGRRLATALALTAAALAVVLATLPAAAAAIDYPPAGDPGGKGKRVAKKGKGKRLVVCKRKRCRYKTISAAVRAARGGDTIKVRNGVYRESVRVAGRRYDGLRIVGNPKRPRKVVLNGKRLRGARAQNGVFVNGADRATIRGIYARNFRANGFFVVNAVGYRLLDLVAGKTGVYGLYAFNSKGGTMARSEAFHNNDAGFYIGQTPVQAKPRRSIVKKVRSYANVIGFSGTNMRYVTIKNSDFFNNGTGIVPNALDSEKFPPAEHNVIAGNRIFWNNFNYYAGAPFQVPESGPAGLPGYPIGVGVLLFGSQDTVVERNRIFGNWLAGFGAIQQIALALSDDLKLQEASVLRDNTVRDNRFGLGGRDLNGRDMFYDGTGTGNCFEGNETHSPNVPADNGTFAPCPGPAQNTRDGAAQQEGLSWVLGVSKDDPDTFEQHWLRHPHVRRRGIRPLVRWRGRRARSSRATATATPVAAAARRRKVVRVADNFFSPRRMRVRRGTKVVWRWSRRNGETHDVFLARGPRGVRRFRSAPAATGYRFKRRLRKPGRYLVICTFHADMKMRIRVRR